MAKSEEETVMGRATHVPEHGLVDSEHARKALQLAGCAPEQTQIDTSDIVEPTIKVIPKTADHYEI